MHSTIKNLIEIENKIKSSLDKLNITNLPKIIAVSKTFKIDKILPLIEYGHQNFGENKIQEAIDKWSDIRSKYPEIKLHMIGKLQSNKVKFAVSLFDFIHSVDSEKLVRKISEEQKKIRKQIKIFIQVNIGNEPQKSGVNIDEIAKIIGLCKTLNLNVVGLMCIPPVNQDPIIYFEKLNKINTSYNFTELSMGMSSDYLNAAQHNASFLRIGSSIFGARV